MRNSPATVAEGTSSILACQGTAAAQAKSVPIMPSWVTTSTTCGSAECSSTASAISRATLVERRPATLLWMARITGSVPDLAASRWRSRSFSSINSVVGSANK